MEALTIDITFPDATQSGELDGSGSCRLPMKRCGYAFVGLEDI